MRLLNENSMAKSIKSSTAKSSVKKGRGAEWTFPKNTLEEAIVIPKAIEEKNAGNPMPSSELAKAVGFNLSNDWRFLNLLRSANLYGLVSGTGSTSIVRLEKLGQDVISPSSTIERQAALLSAFRSVSEFKAVEEFYGGKKIPEDEFFLNTLTRNFNITRDRVERFSEIFKNNLSFLKSFDAYNPKESVTNTNEPIIEYQHKSESTSYPKEHRTRTYLDTCFVMMPFGEWYDKYYQQIYIDAIKDAGFEPVRADELFHTGSVVEQIWEQISKAKILLAELTGKNANVFYELGLAHAAVKPVVFISANVDDVPFDLRHLRVIIYDVREPNWANDLKNKITDYLRNASKDPAKSIPHPFRNGFSNGSNN
jgi:hypothetical protein